MNEDEVGQSVLQTGKRLKGIENRSPPGLLAVNKGYAVGENSQQFSHASLGARGHHNNDVIGEIAA